MKKVENQMTVATYLRDFLRSLKHPNGQKRFQILDGGDVSSLVSRILLHLTNSYLTNKWHCSRLAVYLLYLQGSTQT